MNYKSYADLSIDILKEVHIIPREIQLVVGIPRSGMVPAYMIGAHLNLPVVSLDQFLLGHYGAVGERALRVAINDISRILIVDDSVYSGTAILKAKKQLKELNTDFHYSFCAIYSSTKETSFVDFYFKYLPQPRVFQWNYKNHFITTQSCYDMDGVLCVDPTDEENDDGKRYLQFLLNAKALFIPSYKIPCIVTSRLEKYRKETESWLLKHKVDYEELIMLDLPNAEQRRAKRVHAKFKSKVYKNRPETYFIESSWNQAKEIFKLTNKFVFCAENDVLIKTYTDIVFYENAMSYSNRHFKDIFSDSSEIGLKYQQLKMDYDDLVEQNRSLKSKLKILKENRIVRFSNKSFKQKLLFIPNYILEKIGLKI